jgi:hypothetical protein
LRSRIADARQGFSQTCVSEGAAEGTSEATDSVLRRFMFHAGRHLLSIGQ